MKKARMLSLLLCLTMVIGLFAGLTVSAGAADTGTTATQTVSYVDENGNLVSHECEPVTSRTELLGHTGETHWYYLSQENTVIDEDLGVFGDVYLILTDGCTLTVNAKDPNYQPAAIHVANDEDDHNHLTIYGQDQGTGRLYATGSYSNGMLGLFGSQMSGAGIGGGYEGGMSSTEDGGYVSIYGGQIYATGGKHAPGIGCGWSEFAAGLESKDIVIGDNMLVKAGPSADQCVEISASELNRVYEDNTECKYYNYVEITCCRCDHHTFKTPVSSEADLMKALDLIDESTYLTSGNVSGDYTYSIYLTQDLTLHKTLRLGDIMQEINYNVDLALNGHRLQIVSSGASVGSAMQIAGGSTLNVYDVNDGTDTVRGMIQVDAQYENADVDVITVSGTLNLYSGAICGGTGTYGGVYLLSGNGSRPVFNMYGGTIAENSCEAGGAVYAGPGSTFTMYGGTIRNNNATYGGAVCAYQGTVSLLGGVITGNTTEYDHSAAVHTTAGVTLGGDLQITGNTLKKGTEANLLLMSDEGSLEFTIDEENHPLAETASVGITAWSGWISTNGIKGDEEKFYDDTGSYPVHFDNNRLLLSFIADWAYEDQEDALEGTNACPQDDTCATEQFTDNDPTAWYHDGVHFCIEAGLMNGVSETSFAPEEHLSRAMIVTILWRTAGKPVANYAMTFTDVEADSWYTEAVRWAQASGIVTGYSDTEFAPDDDVTREQLAAILYRYAKFLGVDISEEESTNILDFDDVAEISEYAVGAMQWACGAGIINGDDGRLLPQNCATRAEAATMVERFCEVIEAAESGE